MQAREIADHLRDSQGVDEEEALSQAKWIVHRLDFSTIWDQVDALFEELRLRPLPNGESPFPADDGWVD